MPAPNVDHRPTLRPTRRTTWSLRVLGIALMVTPFLDVPAAVAAGCQGTRQGTANVTAASQSLGASSQVGTNNTMTVTVKDATGAASGYCIDFTQNSGPSTGWGRVAVTDSTGHAAVTWTSNAVGIDSITASVTDANGATGQTQTIRHTWTAKPTPSPTPSPTPKPTVSPTPKPTVSPTPKPTVSPTPQATTSPTAGTPTPTPSASTSPTTTSSPTGSPAPAPTPTTFGNGSIHLNRPSALPGGTATLSGRNCPAGATVTYTVEGHPAGSSTAHEDGTFTGEVQLPDAPIGTHVIAVSCGGLTASVPIDLVVSSSTSTPGSGATAGAVLVFFILLGSVLLGRTNNRKTALPEPDTDD